MSNLSPPESDYKHPSNFGKAESFFNRILQLLPGATPPGFRPSGTEEPDRIAYPVDEFYTKRMNMPGTSEKLGWGEWVDAISRTLADAALMRGGVSIPDWAAGKPLIKRLGELKAKGTIGEAEYEQGVTEYLKRAEIAKQEAAQAVPKSPSRSVIEQLQRTSGRGEEQDLPGLTRPGSTSSSGGDVLPLDASGLPEGYRIFPVQGHGFALEGPDGFMSTYYATAREAAEEAIRRASRMTRLVIPSGLDRIRPTARQDAEILLNNRSIFQDAVGMDLGTSADLSEIIAWNGRQSREAIQFLETWLRRNYGSWYDLSSDPSRASVPLGMRTGPMSDILQQAYANHYGNIEH